MSQSNIINIVRSLAGSTGLDPDLAQAIADVETGLDATKCRYEEGYKYLVTPKRFSDLLGISEATEICFQSISWGPLQVMGANVRSMGFQSQLPLLVQPQLGALYGCRFLHSLSRVYNDINDVISAYNQGGAYKLDSGQYKNQAYVDKVKEKLVRLKKLK